MDKDVLLKEFTYELPESKIAQHPLSKRDQSRLLVYEKDNITEDEFVNVLDYLKPNSLIVLNNSRVVHARLLFPVELSFVEIFCLEPYEQSYEEAVSSLREVKWKSLIGNKKKWKTEIISKQIEINNNIVNLNARKLQDLDGSFVIQFTWDKDISFRDILSKSGLVPLPPYIKRNASEQDSERYQTVYSKAEGSVAAPTAGLHLTGELLEKISSNHTLAEVTLHVGLGTFKPIQGSNINEHLMHKEFFSVTRSELQKMYENNSHITCIGTTSLRTIESLYWISVKLSDDPSTEIMLGQWECYELEASLKREESIKQLIQYLEANNLDSLNGYTSLLIIPGYKFQLCDSLNTNFHQPGSTLLLLVAAYAGSHWRQIYDYALQHNFRFLSYGDSCLIHRRQNGTV